MMGAGAQAWELAAPAWDPCDDAPAEDLLAAAGWSSAAVERCRVLYDSLRADSDGPSGSSVTSLLAHLGLGDGLSPRETGAHRSWWRHNPLRRAKKPSASPAGYHHHQQQPSSSAAAACLYGARCSGFSMVIWCALGVRVRSGEASRGTPPATHSSTGTAGNINADGSISTDSNTAQLSAPRHRRDAQRSQHLAREAPSRWPAGGHRRDRRLRPIARARSGSP